MTGALAGGTRRPPRTARRIAAILAAAAGLAGALPWTAAGAAAARAAAPGPTVIVVLDTNQSLNGWGFGQERAAVRGYVQALPAGVQAGLITFSSRWQLALRPTSSRRRFDAALMASRRGAGTSAGVKPALQAARAQLLRQRASAQRRLLVVTDGETLTGSLPSLPGFPTDVIVLQHDSDDNSSLLVSLAAAAGGRVSSPASAAALAGEFPRPAPSQRAIRHPRHAAHQPAGQRLAPRLPRKLIAVLAGTFVSVLLISLLLISSVTGAARRRRLAGQMERYGPKHAPAAEEEPTADERKAARAALGWASALLRSLNTEKRLAVRLDQAGIARTPAEWLLIGSVVGLLMAGLVTVLTGSALLGVPAGALAGWAIMRLVAGARIARRRSGFNQQLPDVLQFVAGSLRSGFSLQQSIDGVVREDGQPAAGELARALAEARIGIDLDAALETVANRMDSDDFRWTVMAVRIHREVGGNLAEVLDSTAATMREREFLRRHVRGLSAEGRLSAYILIALPLLIGAWLMLSDRAYLRPLFTTGLGLAMVAGGTVLFVIGTLWMRKLVRVEV